MKNFKARILILAFAILSVPSMAAPSAGVVKKRSPKKTTQTDVLQDISLPMASGELQVETAAEQDQRDRANAPKSKVEIGFSSWQPYKLNTFSRVSDLSDYETVGVPATNIGLYTPVSRTVDIELGLDFLVMRREGSVIASGINVRQDQTAYITSLRFGASYSPWSLLKEKLHPYFSAALLPTMVVTRRTAFDDGVNDLGLPMELGLGGVVQITKPIALNLGISEIFGKVQNSDLKGLAVSAAIRFPI